MEKPIHNVIICQVFITRGMSNLRSYMEEIRDMCQKGISQKAIATKYGVSQAAISQLLMRDDARKYRMIKKKR